MSDDIVVGGGGSTAVATEELFEHAQALERLERELADCRRRLVTWPLTEEIDSRVTNHVAWASGAIEEAMRDCGELATGLRQASERYGALERSLSRVHREVGADAAYLMGLVLPGLVVLHGPAILLGLLSAATVLTAMGGGPARTVRTIGDWLRANPRVANNPLVASLARTAVSSIDDFGTGAVLAPPAARHLLGDNGLGIVGVPEAGAVVIGGVAGLGLLRESAVEVRRVESAAAGAQAASGVAGGRTVAAPPRGFGELADRIPPPVAGGAQVRVEAYAGPRGERRFLVYVGGTLDPSPLSSGEPWDATSGARSVVAQDSAAVRAVERVMVEAGIDAGDPVMIAGYSLGGVVAREVAEGGAFAVSGVVTLGSPAGQIPVPDGVSVVTVEHREDVIAALGGHPLPTGDGALDPVVVRRSVLDEAGRQTGDVFAAHGLDDYRKTAHLMDRTEEARVSAARDEVSSFLREASEGTVSYWRADRVAPGG